MLRLSGLVNNSIVDGPGLRYTVFVQGCPHNCEGCHNPQTHSFKGGKNVEVYKLAAHIAEEDHLDGVTYSGGEPFCQARDLCALTDLLPSRLNIVTFTGFTFEHLLLHSTEHNFYRELLLRTDILIDGKFILNQRDISLRFRGSRNQRVIDCKKSLELGYVVPFEFTEYKVCDTADVLRRYSSF